MSGAVEMRDILDFPGYRIGSDRSVWTGRRGGEWRRLKVLVQMVGGRPCERITLRQRGRSWTVRVDELMMATFPATPSGCVAPPGLPEGVAFRPVPGFPGYGVGSDCSAWSRLRRGGRVGRVLRARRPEAVPWRRLEVARVDGRAPCVQMIRDRRRRWVSLDAAMHAAFGTSPDDGPPPGVDVRPVPGFPGCEVGADFSLWHRPPDADYEVVGLPPPRRRLAATLGRTGVPAVWLDVGGRRVEVPVARLIRAAFAPEELAGPDPPAPEDPPAIAGGSEPPPAAPAVQAAGGRPAGVEYRPIEGFPGYEVGSDYTAWSRLSRPVRWRRMSIQVSAAGRRCLNLRRDGRAHWVCLDELRARAFAPQLPRGRPGEESQVRGSAHGRARLDEAKVIEARWLKRQGWTYPALAERYRVGKVALFYAISGRTWGHVPTDIAPR